MNARRFRSRTWLPLLPLLALGACGDAAGPDDDGRPAPPPPPPAQLVANFDQGSAEGWSTRGPNNGLRLTNLSVTQPYAIAAQGTSLTSEWWFVASSLFTGDLSGYYGGDISYQHQYGGPNAARRGGADIRIESTGGRVLTYAHPVLQPPEQWRDHIAFLREGEGWLVDGIHATGADIRAVLGSVRSIEIRGSRRHGRDWSVIDRVLLMPPLP